MTIKENPIIQVKHLSKKYRIGMDRTYKTFSENVTNLLKSPLKTIKNIRKHNDIFWALKDINFEVNRGEILGIIGRNGAGKTTLLKILNRITYLTEGEVILRGRVGSLLEVGTGFHPELTGRENIYFNGAILGMKKQEIENKFDEIVGFSGVKKFLDTPIKRYSSGMQVRLAFSVAAHLEPEILLIDEVLAVGDAQFQNKCLEKMEDISRRERTVLFVSHNMGAINKLCTKAMFIENGSIKRIGFPNEIVQEYLNVESSLQGYKIWENENSAPGDDIIRLLRVTIKDSGGKINYRFGMDAPFIIEIKYILLKEAPSTKIGVKLIANNGDVVFVSNDGDFLDIANKRKKGIYVTQCYIPANLLNIGFYYITVNAVIPLHRQHFEKKNILKIEINSSGGVGAHIADNRKGLIRPLLKWALKKEN